MKLINAQTQEVLIPNVEVASTIWQRFRGLMFRRNVGHGFGLWLEPCRSIHTMWMPIPIDVYFIDQDGLIVEHRARVAPWSIVIPNHECRTVLEVPYSTNDMTVGTKVCLQERNP